MNSVLSSTAIRAEYYGTLQRIIILKNFLIHGVKEKKF